MYPWETEEADSCPPCSNASPYPWEREEGQEEDAEGDMFYVAEDDLEADQREVACKDFLDSLTFLYMMSQISAERFCTLCFFAAKGGMGDSVGMYGLASGKQSGKYSRHCKKMFDMPKKSSRHYTLLVPGHDPHALSRVTHELQVAPAHEVIDEVVRSEPNYKDNLKEAADSNALPPSWYAHKLKGEGDDLAVPLCLYMDAVPYSLTDSCIGLWAQELVGSRRFILAFCSQAVCLQLRLPRILQLLGFVGICALLFLGACDRALA